MAGERIRPPVDVFRQRAITRVTRNILKFHWYRNDAQLSSLYRRCNVLNDSGNAYENCKIFWYKYVSRRHREDI